MYKSEFFPLLVSAEHSFHQTTLMEVQVFQPIDYTTKPPEIITYALQLFATIYLITIWEIAFFVFLRNFRKFPRNRKVAIYRFQPLPCIKCHFFNNNQHLKCAVQPSIVSTKKALNCSDYCPKSQ